MPRQRTNMIKYMIKRILMMIPMLFFVLTFTWILSHMMSVSPLAYRLGGILDPELIEAEKQRIGFYDPWYVQLGVYYKNFFSGDWGIAYSISESTPVFNLIVEDLFPKTFELMIIPIIISPIIAVKLGLIAASYKDKSKDTLIRIIAIIGAGFPVFWVAIMLQMFFGLYIETFTMGSLDFYILNENHPGVGLTPGPDNAPKTGFRIIDSILYNDQMFLWDTLLHLIIPVICITFISLASITRLTRSTMLDVLDQDYIRTARAKGVLEEDVISKHALRNALIPTSNLIIGATATALLGSFFIEIVFEYKGMGFRMVNSILLGDYLLINGILVFQTIILLTGTLFADIMYTIIDPRIVYT